MKNLAITLAILAALAYGASPDARQRYNAHENRYETTSRDAELEYNVHENEWSYQPRGSKLEYNAHENTYEYAPPDRGGRDPYAPRIGGGWD